MNRFLIVGSLQECRIDLYKTHAKVRMSIAVNHLIISSTYLIIRKWRQDGYNRLCDMISDIHPKFDGWVYVNDKQYYKMESVENTSRLLLTGNITEWHDNVYFNTQHIDFSNNITDSIMIEVDGQWVDNDHLLNVFGDTPRVLTIKRPYGAVGVCNVRLGYDCGYEVNDDCVATHDNGLWVQSVEPTGSEYSKLQIEKMMLEWSII